MNCVMRSFAKIVLESGNAPLSRGRRPDFQLSFSVIIREELNHILKFLIYWKQIAFFQICFYSSDSTVSIFIYN